MKRPTLSADEFWSLRNAAGMSLTDVAWKLGVPVTTVSRWETGRHRIKPKRAVQLIAMLDREDPVAHDDVTR